MNTRYEILPDIYIGHRETVKDKIANQICRTESVIDADKLFSFINVARVYTDTEIKKNMQKYEIDKAVEVLVSKSREINNNIKNNKSSLIICNSVDQYSPSIVLAYLMIYGKMRLLEGLKIIKSKKSNVFTSNLVLSTALNRIASRI
jgi:hypothetical protein